MWGLDSHVILIDYADGVPEQPSASAAPMTASSGLTTHSQHTALPLSNKNPPASLAPSTVSQWLPDQGSSVLESVQDRNAIQKDGEKSPKVKALSNQFLVFHGASYVCAMGTLAASGYYAMCIAQKYL